MNQKLGIEDRINKLNINLQDPKEIEIISKIKSQFSPYNYFEIFSLNEMLTNEMKENLSNNFVSCLGILDIERDAIVEIFHEYDSNCQRYEGGYFKIFHEADFRFSSNTGTKLAPRNGGSGYTYGYRVFFSEIDCVFSPIRTFKYKESNVKLVKVFVPKHLVEYKCTREIEFSNYDDIQDLIDDLIEFKTDVDSKDIVMSNYGIQKHITSYKSSSQILNEYNGMILTKIEKSIEKYREMKKVLDDYENLSEEDKEIFRTIFHIPTIE